MKFASSALLVAVTLGTFGLFGCGKSDPNANLPPERMAPAPEKLGDNPEYAKQFGKKGK